jgi:hypothetical protein
MNNQDEKIKVFIHTNNNQPIENTKQYLGNQIALSGREFDGFKFDITDSPLSEIEKCKGIIIKQELEYFEIITGFERNTSYNIFGETSEGYKYLFKCKENTGCLARWLCPTATRKLHMNFLKNSSNDKPENIVNFLKPFKCPFFCLGRPEIFLELEESKEKIGRILEVFSCSEHLYEIYDSEEKIKYIVKGKCCQCGLLFSNTILGRIGEALFNIIDPETKEEIGSISRQTSAMSEGVNDGENFKINFPEKTSTNDKLLLMALGLMIDYQNFEIGSTN